MEICKEMQKLRDWLDENNIPWMDQSEDYHIDLGDLGKMWMCRTKFEIGGVLCSVINGYGSYGGFNSFEKDNQGLLEIWADQKINDGSPEGYLTADEIIKMVTDNYMVNKEGRLDEAD